MIVVVKDYVPIRAYAIGMNARNRYFPGFDTLRFYAAICVVVGHVADLTGARPLLAHLFINGNYAVLFFFVLSGFLITHLLLDERDRSGRVDLGAFYMRRVLRIWPAYFLVLGVAYLFFHAVEPPLAWQTYALFLGNIGIGFIATPAFGPLWSIGLEEQFYLIWGYLMSRLSKGLPVLLACLIVARWLFYFAAIASNTYELERIVGLNRFDALAVGCLAAYAYHAGLLPQVYRLERLWWLLFALAVVFGDGRDTALLTTALAALFACLLLCVGTKPRLLIRLPNARLVGNMSYSIYLWHYPIMTLVLLGTHDFGAVLTLTLSLTLTVAYLSYRFYEAPFLRLKARFQPRPALAPVVTD